MAQETVEQTDLAENEITQEEEYQVEITEVINVLLSYEAITQEQIDEAMVVAKESKITLEDALVQLEYINYEYIAAALQQITGTPYVKLEDYELTEELIAKVPKQLAIKFRMIPIQLDEEKLIVAMDNPYNVAALDSLGMAIGYYVESVIAPKNEIDEALNTHYNADDADSLNDLLQNLGDEDVEVLTDPDGNLGGAAEQVNDTPVIKYVQKLIMRALKDRASDLHLEPFESQFRVRERVDGVLLKVPSPPRNFRNEVVSRIKIMAELNIAETRLPQDGSIRLKLSATKSIDLRVACLPTMFGESVVLRVLDRSATLLTLKDLGLSESIEKIYRKALAQPNGIIMVTGPTGCGKTTTLYAGIQEINNPEVKTITVEDPVEYEIYGMMQCQVNEKVGMTFPAALRSILRQDPDIILIGEMRDPETAGIAIESALTGHLVLSTTHTNEAAGTITRLIDMGVEPFLITSTVQAIIAQRLVRLICPNCKEEYIPEPETFLKIGKRIEDYKDRTFYHGKGCDQCAQTGYYGRIGLYEAIEISEALMELIVKKAPANVLHSKAIELGMVPMREDGFQKFLNGITTLEEVIRVAPIESGVSLEE